MCVCVCVRERERERERSIGKWGPEHVPLSLFLEAEAANNEKHPTTTRSSTFKAEDIDGFWHRWNRWCGLAFFAIDRNGCTVFASFYSI